MKTLLVILAMIVSGCPKDNSVSISEGSKDTTQVEDTSNYDPQPPRQPGDMY
jgi:hypothetical protein